MRTRVLLSILLLAAVCSGECLPFQKAANKIGASGCVSGKVLKIGKGNSGTYFLDFCEDYADCPFTVVVFQDDLKEVGDISKLEGRDIEIHGTIEEWRGKAEIVLKDSDQLRGEFRHLPAAPKNYDASRRGNFSAGTFKGQQSSKMSKKRPKSSLPQDLGVDTTQPDAGDQ